MPLTRISLLEGKSSEYRRAISDSFHRALVEAFDVPPADRFQVIEQFEPGELIFDRDYLGGPRSNDFVLFNITAGKPRSVATKRAFYRRLIALLAEAPGVRPQDVMVVITMTTPDEWSFSGGDPGKSKPPDRWGTETIMQDEGNAR